MFLSDELSKKWRWAVRNVVS